jgi:uncharacterized protein (TIGR01244 family)
MGLRRQWCADDADASGYAIARTLRLATDIHNFREVDDRLSTGGQPTEAQLASAAAAGFQVVINLGLHDDPRYSLPDEPGCVSALGMEYVHIPVQFREPTEADLTTFCHAMQAHQGKKVLVHCAANKRVTAFVGLYGALRLGWSRERAFALMRSVWEPDEVWMRFISSMLRDSHG